MSRLSRSQGFSLLEILVAFAIAAMALGMLYRVTGNNARQAGGLMQQERAMLLAAYETVPPQGLNESAQGNDYAWAISSRPYPTPANNAPQAARLHEVRVNVQWQDGTNPRSFELASLRPERLPVLGAQP